MNNAMNTLIQISTQSISTMKKTKPELLVDLDILEEHLQDLDRASRKNNRNRGRLDKQIDDIINEIEEIKTKLKDYE